MRVSSHWLIFQKNRSIACWCNVLMVVTKDKNDKMAGLDIRKLDYPVYEGIGLLKFPNCLENAGQTIQNIKDLKLGPDAVILATFPRSGKPNLITCPLYSKVAGLSIY